MFCLRPFYIYGTAIVCLLLAICPASALKVGDENLPLVVKNPWFMQLKGDELANYKKVVHAEFGSGARAMEMKKAQLAYDRLSEVQKENHAMALYFRAKVLSISVGDGDATTPYFYENLAIKYLEAALSITHDNSWFPFTDAERITASMLLGSAFHRTGQSAKALELYSALWNNVAHYDEFVEFQLSRGYTEDRKRKELQGYLSRELPFQVGSVHADDENYKEAMTYFDACAKVDARCANMAAECFAELNQRDDYLDMARKLTAFDFALQRVYGKPGKSSRWSRLKAKLNGAVLALKVDEKVELKPAQLLAENAAMSKHGEIDTTTPFWSPKHALSVTAVAAAVAPTDVKSDPAVGAGGAQVFSVKDFITAEESQELIDLFEKSRSQYTKLPRLCLMDTFNASSLTGMDRSKDSKTEAGRRCFELDGGNVEAKKKGEGAFKYLQQSSSSTHVLTGQNALLDEVEKRIEVVLGLPRKNAAYTQLLRYQPGESYAEHADCGFNLLSVKDSAKRAATVLIYLSVPEGGGGETAFPRLGEGGVKVEPETGKLLFFTSLTDEGYCDPASVHIAHAPKATTKATGRKVNKYIIQKWYHDLSLPQRSESSVSTAQQFGANRDQTVVDCDLSGSCREHFDLQVPKEEATTKSEL